MYSDNIKEEMILLELQLKAITEEFDAAIGNGMVLKDAKVLFHQLRIISAKLLDLKNQQTSNDR